MRVRKVWRRVPNDHNCTSHSNSTPMPTKIYYHQLDYTCIRTTRIHTCTCLGFHPGRVEPASSEESNILLIEEDILEFDWGNCPIPTRRNALFAADFAQTHWQSDPRPPVAGTDTSCIFTRALLSGLQPWYRWVPDQSALGGPIPNRNFRRHSSGTIRCHRPATLRGDWILGTVGTMRVRISSHKDTRAHLYMHYCT